MIIYTYDGTFEGLLTSIHEAYYRYQNPSRIIQKTNMQYTIMDTYINISTDMGKYNKVYQAIQAKISFKALQDIFYVYLSDTYDSGTWIYEYVKLGFKHGSNVENMLADDRVSRVQKMCRKVFGEMHRMLGLLRFRKISEDIYYAPIQPVYNITALMAPHFSLRFSDQNWVIHDVKRKYAAVYNKKSWILTDMEISESQDYDDFETSYQELWKAYFRNIAIEDRKNLRLQMQNMPKRYWINLIEKQPTL